MKESDIMLINREKLRDNIIEYLNSDSMPDDENFSRGVEKTLQIIMDQSIEFEWKNVEDELPTPSEFDPDYSDDVLILDEDGYYRVGCYWHDDEPRFEDDDGNKIKVAKWTYFPEPEIELEEVEEYNKEFTSIIDRVVFECIWNRYFGDGIGREEDYKNDTFECHVYCWNEEVWNNEYHFWHKPTGYKLRWYKYPLRGAEANMDLTPRQFLEILVDCQNSVYRDQGIKMEDKTVGKWWEENNNAK